MAARSVCPHAKSASGVALAASQYRIVGHEVAPAPAPEWIRHTQIWNGLEPCTLST